MYSLVLAMCLTSAEAQPSGIFFNRGAGCGGQAAVNVSVNAGCGGESRAGFFSRRGERHGIIYRLRHRSGGCGGASAPMGCGGNGVGYYETGVNVNVGVAPKKMPVGSGFKITSAVPQTCPCCSMKNCEKWAAYAAAKKAGFSIDIPPGTCPCCKEADCAKFKASNKKAAADWDTRNEIANR